MNTATRQVKPPRLRQTHLFTGLPPDRLIELRTRYEAMLLDPTTPRPHRIYARAAIAELKSELNRQGVRGVAA